MLSAKQTGKHDRVPNSIIDWHTAPTNNRSQNYNATHNNIHINQQPSINQVVESAPDSWSRRKNKSSASAENVSVRHRTLRHQRDRTMADIFCVEVDGRD